MFELVKPALLRAVIYFVPIVLGLLAGWLAAKGFGMYNEAAGTYTFTVDFQVLVTYIIAFLAAPATALTALLRGWKPLIK